MTTLRSSFQPNVLLKLLFCAAAALCVGASSAAALEWSPDGILFRPLAANPLEARVAVLFQPAADKLRLDIGTTIDLAAIPGPDGETRFGVDFFTLTRLRSVGRFKFPVETSDYFFGVNVSRRHEFADWTFLGRMRLAHISSHLVDGYEGSRQPFTYSREFVELIGAAEIDEWRAYGGFTWLFSSIPDDFGALTPQLGVDVMWQLAGNLFLRGGYNLTAPSISGDIEIVQATDLGIKFGTRDGAGVVLSFRSYNGPSVHGMFYDRLDSYGAVSLEAEF